jgi:hypothetical protein
MALKIQAYWGDVQSNICWTATMKTQEPLEMSVIICQSKGRNMPDYLNPTQNRCENPRSRSNGFIYAFPNSLHTGVSSLKAEKFSPNRKATFLAGQTCYFQTLKKRSALHIRK